ncbi:MAG: phosphonate metabolism transcriptional regulator PhnF [Rhodobacteraceae bacterium]|nr:phosphonate metabolism transcriptional regulator PhnF [Paracoccaceae bacterium]
MADTALWRQIADALAAEISSGRYRPGDRMPSEGAMAERFGVHRHTLRRAVAALSDEGLVRSRRGAGVFVAHRPTAYRLGPRTRFSANILAEGATPETRVLRLETRRAAVREAAALGVATGAAVHLRETVGLADGVPVVLGLSLFPAERFPRLPQDLGETGSVTAALARGGLADYLRRETQLSVRRATAIEARHLDSPEGTALLIAEWVNTDSDGRPVETGTSRFHGERVQLVVEGSPTSPS